MRWPRWVLAGGGGLALVLGFAAWVVFTDVGAPDDPYPAAPEPCELLSDDTVDSLVGQAFGERSEPYGLPGWRPLQRGDEHLRCEWRSDEDEVVFGRLQVEVATYHSPQFGLGRSGPESAQLVFEETRHRGCAYELSGEDEAACAQSVEPPLRLTVQRENVIVQVAFTPEVDRIDEWDSEQAVVGLVDEVMSRLATI